MRDSNAPNFQKRLKEAETRMEREARRAGYILVGGGFLVVLAVIGWIMNIAAIWNATEITGMVVARAIGVFIVPLGAVLGYF